MKDLVPPEYVIDLRAFQYEYFVVGNMIFLLFADAYQYARVTGTLRRREEEIMAMDIEGVKELQDAEVHLYEVYEEFDSEGELKRFLEGGSDRPTATWRLGNVRYKGKTLYTLENMAGYESMELFEDLNEFYKQNKPAKAINMDGPPLLKPVRH